MINEQQNRMTVKGNAHELIFGTFLGLAKRTEENCKKWQPCQITAVWNVTLCSLEDISEEPAASFFRQATQ
jgi:hypothetical protein